MVKVIRLLLIMVICTGFLAACGQPDAKDSAGKSYFFKDYQDKWIVLNYWASWCKPCYSEIPELNQLHLQHQDKLVVLGVNFDQMDSKALQEFAQKQHINYPLLAADPGIYFGIKEVPSLPATFLISPGKKQAIVLYGPQKAADILAYLK